MARESNIDDLESEALDVESIQVERRVNQQIATRRALMPGEARHKAFRTDYKDDDDGEDDEVYDNLGGLFSTPNYREEDNRDFPVHVHDELPKYDDVAYVRSVKTDEDVTSLHGLVVRVEDVGQWGTQTLFLAGRNGTTVVEIQSDHTPAMRAGDLVVLGNVEREDEHGGAAWKQTPESSVVVLDNSTYPAGYWLEERSALVQAESWYDDRKDWKAQDIVKNTILKEYHIETPRGQDDQMWMYIEDETSENYGLFTRHGEEYIRELLDEHLPEWKTNQRTKNAVVASLIDQTRVPEDRFAEGEPDEERLRWSVGVENGVIDLRTGELHDHGPEWRLTGKLPVEYHPDVYDGLGDELDWFISDVTKTESDRECLLYAIGHALARCYPDECVFSLIGPGENGKSVLAEVIETLFGGLAGDFKMSAMAGDGDFGTGSLVGNNVVIDDDATDVKLHNSGMLKSHSGGKSAEINIKNVPRDSHDNYATLLMLSNNPPVFADKTKGLKRRMYPAILPYQYTDDPSDDNKDAVPKEELLARLTTEDELKALLSVAVQYAGRIYDDGVDDGRSREERWNLYENYSDSILRFWKECMNESSGSRVTRNAVYEVYVQWCKENGVDPVSPGGKSGFWPLSRECHSVSFDYDAWLDGDRAVEHVELAPEALEYAPEWVADKWEADIDENETTLANRLDRPTPLADLNGGYCSTEARVIARGYADEREETGVQLTLEDDTTAIDAIAWDDEFDGVHVGDLVRLDRAKLTQYRSVPQLKTAGPTEVRVVEEGPNAREASELNGSDDLDMTAVDDDFSVEEGGAGSVEDALKDVTKELDAEHESGAPAEDVTDTVLDRYDVTRDVVEHSVEKLKKKGELYEPATDRLRVT